MERQYKNVFFSVNKTDLDEVHCVQEVLQNNQVALRLNMNMVREPHLIVEVAHACAFFKSERPAWVPKDGWLVALWLETVRPLRPVWEREGIDT
jgi:hypothetical protein